MIKRIFDITIATFFLVLFALPMLVFAILIKLSSPGPILFRIERVGKDARIFTHYRFRKLRVDSHQATWIGRFLNNTSLDDLPTFFNVITGDLSIVGPRPEIPERIDMTDETWQRILSVKPGIISPAVLLFLRKYNETSIPM